MRYRFSTFGGMQSRGALDLQVLLVMVVSAGGGATRLALLYLLEVALWLLLREMVLRKGLWQIKVEICTGWRPPCSLHVSPS